MVYWDDYVFLGTSQRCLSWRRLVTGFPRLTNG